VAINAQLAGKYMSMDEFARALECVQVLARVDSDQQDVCERFVAYRNPP